MYICICNAVTDREIRQAVSLGAASLQDLREGLGVAANCGKCVGCVHGVLREELASPSDTFVALHRSGFLSAR